MGEEFFPYIGYIRPDLLEPMHHRNYPWLYTSAVLWAKQKGHIGENYVMTSYPVDIQLLTRGVKRSISAINTIYEEEMGLLGITKDQVSEVVRSLMHKRRRTRSSSSSSSD